MINVDVGSPGVVDVDDFQLEEGSARAIKCLNEAKVQASLQDVYAIGSSYYNL